MSGSPERCTDTGCVCEQVIQSECVGVLNVSSLWPEPPIVPPRMDQSLGKITLFQTGSGNESLHCSLKLHDSGWAAHRSPNPPVWLFTRLLSLSVSEDRARDKGTNSIGSRLNRMEDKVWICARFTGKIFSCTVFSSLFLFCEGMYTTVFVLFSWFCTFYENRLPLGRTVTLQWQLRSSRQTERGAFWIMQQKTESFCRIRKIQLFPDPARPCSCCCWLKYFHAVKNFNSLCQFCSAKIESLRVVLCSIFYLRCNKTRKRNEKWN